MRYFGLITNNMKIISLIALITLSHLAIGQSKSTQKLHEKYDDAFTMFFYKSTIKMLESDKTKEFMEIVKGIEKAKILKVDKYEKDFDENDIVEYKDGIKDEDFEEVMSIRQKNGKFNVYLKEKNGVTKGIIVTLDSEDQFAILDIVGEIALDKISTLTDKMDFN